VNDSVSATSGGDTLDGDSALTIQQASRELNLPAPTIRSWERRYGLPVTGRSHGGHRRYTGNQLAALRRMRDLVAQGRRAVDAAAQVKAEYETTPAPLIEALLRASHNFEPGTIGEIFDVAQKALGLDRTVDEVLLPAMRQIGQSWQTGGTDVSHEHLATHATQAWLSKISRTGPPLLDYQPIILSCGPSDHHTLGLEALSALLRQRGWDCRLLGARTPAESLGRAVHDTDAAGVVLVCHLTSGRLAAIDSLSSAELRHTHIFYAGGAFSSLQARHGLPGHYLGTNFTQAAEFITSTVIGTAHVDRDGSDPGHRA
jgi:methanogenic corrinoid protein MtbC1